MSEEGAAEDDKGADDNVVRVQFGSAPKPSQPEDSDYEATDSERSTFEAFCELIDRGMVMITFDGRYDGVLAPASLVGQPQVSLNFSHRFSVDDFQYDARAVRATLSFGGVDCFCEVPWGAVWMMRSHVDQELMLVPDHVPTELRQALEGQAAEMRALAEVPREAPEAGADVVHEDQAGQQGDAEDADPDDHDPDDDPKGRGGLRLVKG